MTYQTSPQHWGSVGIVAPLRAAARLATPGNIATGLAVVTGDSRAEAFSAPSIGSRQAISYGFAGITVGDTLETVSGIECFSPSNVLLIDGVNDTALDPGSAQELALPADFASLLATYKALPTAPNIIVTTPLGLENGFALSPSVVASRSLRTHQISQMMITACAAAGVICIDFNSIFATPGDANFTAATGMTLDGVHYSTIGWEWWLGEVKPHIV